MATFKEIRGQLIRKYTTNPTDPLEGQMWYNNTTGTLKGVTVTSAWSSGAPLSTARFATAGAGIQTAALVAGGYSTAVVGITEEYDGSGWSAGGDLNQARYYIGGAGTQTAAIAMSGRNPPAGWSLTNTEDYNGASWTNTTASPTALNQVTTTGTQTATLLWGGVNAPSSPNVSTTYEFDGSTWTSGGALPGVLKVAGAFGTQTAAMSAGNEDGSTLYYNGASWSDQSATIPYSGADYWNYAGTSGTQTAGVIAGGGPTAVTTTAIWDGSAWAANPALATARLTGPMGPIGTSTAGIVAGGEVSPGVTAATEEFNRTGSVITAAAWAAGGNMLDGIQVQSAGFGLQTAAVQVGGQINPAPPYMTNATGKYDGTSWTASGVYPANIGGIGTTGTQTAGLAFGGTPDFASYVTAANEYDGSTWTAATAYPVAYRLVCGVGPQTAALAATGDAYPASPRYSSLCNDYNGSSWTAAAANTGSARYAAMAAGTATAAAICGGTNPASGATEEFNGASWTTGGVNLANKSAGGATKSGTSDDWLLFATNDVLCTGYDGTSWSTRPSLGTARYDTGGAGTASAGLAFGGGPNSSQKNSTEEFTPEASAANIKTITTS